jgi:WD40 repeat protein
LEFEPMRVVISAMICGLALSLGAPVIPRAAAQESPEGFQTLFNGQDLTGWRVERGDPALWGVEDGAIVGRSQDYRTRSFLLTDREYSDFVLRLEFNLDRGTGSAVSLRAMPGEEMPYKNGSRAYDHPMLKLIESPGREQTGTTHWLRAEDLGGVYLQPDHSAQMHPAGSWNTLEIEVRGRSLRASVNGKPVLETTSEAGATFPDGSLPGLNRVKGRIGLQKHTGKVRFRNISVREFASKPILVLNSGGHTDGVGFVAFKPDGSELISASGDGTIRFWSVATGESLRVLRPMLIPGGGAGTGALSPDGKLLAVVRSGIRPSEHWIYIIALPDGRITKVIPAAHTSTVRRLEFSPDGKSLASCGDDAQARLWNVQTGDCERVFRGHKSPIRGLSFSPDGRLLATSSGDETARIWFVENGQTQAVLKDTERRAFTLNSISFASDGRTLATTSWGDQVRIWNLDGTVRKRFPFGAGIVRFTADPTRLLVGSERSSFVLDITNGNKSMAFAPRTIAVWACAVSPDGKLAATAGAGGDNLFLWSTEDAKVVHHLMGKGRPVWGVGWSGDGNRIAWGNSGGWTTFRKAHPLERTFDFRALTLEGRAEEQFERFRAKQGDLSVRLNGTSGSVTLLQGGADGPTIHGLNQGGTGAFTFVPYGRVALSDIQTLSVYDARTGKQELKFNIASNVRELSVSPNDHFLLSGSSDEILRIWAFGRPDPLLSLFVAGDDWVAWTPDGYYAASSGGEQLMGWQVNNGPYAMGTFYPASQFRKTLYRPDVIKRLLDAGSLEKALADADAAAGTTTRQTDVAQILPPKVSITKPSSSQVKLTDKTLDVEAVAQSARANPVTALRVLLDSRPVPDGLTTFPNPIGGTARGTWTIEVPSGTHRLTVEASGAASKSVSDPVEVIGAGGDDGKAAGKLYLVVVGINDYLHLGNRAKLDCAVPDAQSIHKAFRDLSRPLFRSVESRILLDRQATRANILDALNWLKNSAAAGDKAVVFYAGHGDNQVTGQFFILPVDARIDDLKGTGISDDDLKKAIGELPCSTVLMLDACYSGSFGTKKKRKTRSLGKPTDALASSMVNDYGLAIICGARDNQEAIEEGGHGFFTQALTQGMAGAADADKDGVVELYELLPFVKSRVSKLSAGDQVPTIGIPPSVESFALSKP